MAAPGCCAFNATVENNASIATRTKMSRPQAIFVRDPLVTLEQELQCYLHDAGLVATSTSYITEPPLTAVVDRSVRIRKLRMVEDVEGFCPELQFGAFGNRGALEQSHIIIVDAGTGEVSPHCVSYLPNWFQREELRVEIGLPLARVFIYKKFAAVVRVAGHIYVCIKCAKQRIIVVLR